MRILIAEDERITRASLVRQLESLGHAVTDAEDGESAWDSFSAGEFDIVITDWEMPRLSGLELIQRVRAVERANYVYIMMLTGRSDKQDIVRGIECGADDFLSKPFNREELRARLLAGERVVRLERALSAQNDELRAASERMRKDLLAAARAQRAMLPRENIETSRVRATWTYVPTDELAGDAIGLRLVDDRHLVSYIADVTGHGVPAALLAVRAMHAMSSSPADQAPADGRGRGREDGALASPAARLTELNRRFCDDASDGRFLTMILCELDTHEGRLRFARAGHPFPLLLRDGAVVEVSEAAGLPLAIMDSAEYEDVEMQLAPGDRLCLLSDGVLEQLDPSGREEFGEARLRSLLVSGGRESGARFVERTVDSLVEWAGARRFTDDVSLVVVDWVGGG